MMVSSCRFALCRRLLLHQYSRRTLLVTCKTTTTRTAAASRQKPIPPVAVSPLLPVPPSCCRYFSSWYPPDDYYDDDDFDHLDDERLAKLQQAQRVWNSSSSSLDADASNTNSNDSDDDNNDSSSSHWTTSIAQEHSSTATASKHNEGTSQQQHATSDLRQVLQSIQVQELEGGRMAQRQLGVLREDPVEDMRLLTTNYTVPSLASALRDREELLQQCAQLCKDERYGEVHTLLKPFQHDFVLQRRRQKQHEELLQSSLTMHSLERLRTALMRMPRRVVHAHYQRAGVVLALANVNGMPCVVLEKRAAHLRAHPDEVCLPGGMVYSAADSTIVSTCLREMQEEIGGLHPNDFVVLGVLRCNWGEVHHLVGVAVTPVVCFVGDFDDTTQLQPNPDEVAQVFTIPLVSLLRGKNWIHRKDFAPVFVGGPHVIWGLSGYILERFAKDILSQFHGGV